jgi:hypothetical protein
MRRRPRIGGVFGVLSTEAIAEPRIVHFRHGEKKNIAYEAVADNQCGANLDQRKFPEFCIERQNNSKTKTPPLTGPQWS